MQHAVLGSLSLQIVASFLKDPSDVQTLTQINKKAHLACATSKYPSLIPFNPSFQRLFPQVTSVLINARSIAELGGPLWQDNLTNVASIDLQIDDATDLASVLLRPATFDLLHSLTIKTTARSPWLYLLIRNLPAFQLLRRLEMETFLLYESDAETERSIPEIARLLQATPIRVLVLRDFDVVVHRHLREVLFQWGGQMVCLLRDTVDRAALRAELPHTPPNMIFFIRTANLTNADVELFLTGVVRFINTHHVLSLDDDRSDIAAWREFFRLYAIMNVFMQNCTATKGRKIFFRAQLVREMTVEGELITRPWFLKNLDTLRFIEGADVAPSTTELVYDIFESLRTLDLTCSVDTVLRLRIPHSVETLLVCFRGAVQLLRTWDLSALANLRVLSLANLEKHADLRLPPAATALTLRNVCDKLFDLYRLDALTHLKALEIAQCDDIPRLILPTSLVALTVADCLRLYELHRFPALAALESLTLRNCPLITALDLPETLRTLAVAYCDGVTALPSLSRLTALDACSIATDTKQIALPPTTRAAFLSLSPAVTALPLALNTALTALTLYASLPAVDLPRSLQTLHLLHHTAAAGLDLHEHTNLTTLTLANVALAAACSLPLSVRSVVVTDSAVPALAFAKSSPHIRSLALTAVSEGVRPEGIEEWVKGAQDSITEDVSALTTLTLPAALHSLALRRLPALSALVFPTNGTLRAVTVADCPALCTLALPPSVEFLACTNLSAVSSLAGLELSRTTQLAVRSCGAVNSLTLPTSLLAISVAACPALSLINKAQLLPSLAMVRILHCGMLQDLALPPSVKLLEVVDCAPFNGV